MTITKSSLPLALGMILLAGQFLLSGCSSGTTTSEQQVSSPPPPMDTSTTTIYRRQ
jgi:uncharacterized lipoprotein YajG